jgi:hypothetical protein
MSNHQEGSTPTIRGAWRRDRLLARWRLSTVIAAVVALAALGAVLATALSLGGFGIPSDSAPQTISPGAVPFGLLSRSSPSLPPSSTPRGHAPLVPIYIYFVGQKTGHLVSVLAEIPRPVTISSKLAVLFNGPGGQTGGPAIETSVPSGTQVQSATVTPAGLATVDLSPEIENASGEPLIQAFAQMVFTIARPTTCPAVAHRNPARELPATTTTTTTPGSPPCVDKVVFEVEGQPLDVPLGNGAQTSRPIKPSDYSELAP